MNDPEILAAAAGCPHCRSRRECACPDGPEKCPDNPKCPCDKSVCPCAAHRRHAEPPGCLARPLMLGLGAALVVGLLVLIGVLVLGGNDESGETQPQLSSDTVATAPSVASTSTSTTSTAPVATDPPDTAAPPTPSAPVPPLGPGVAADVDAIFGGAGLFAPDHCTPVLPGMRQIDQTGGSPLTDPSLNIEAFCMQRVTLDGSQVPMLSGDFLLLAAVHETPLMAETNITYQPGIGLDRPGVTNLVPADAGEGLLQLPIDTAAFGGNLDGWAEAQFYSLPNFGPSDLFGYAFSQPGSAVTAFALPSDSVPYDTRIFLQSFGRLTAPGAVPTNADPSSSTLVVAGASPCLGDCVVAPGRFQVQVEWPSATGEVVSGGEGSNGDFWFVSPDGIDVLVRVLNACGLESERYWVFAGNLTDVDWTLTVTDSTTGDALTYRTPLGAATEAILDTDAFATCP